ncbi:MAG: hypothetical protein ACRD1N_00855, partial [Terriglobia bacterium]
MQQAHAAQPCCSRLVHRANQNGKPAIFEEGEQTMTALPKRLVSVLCLGLFALGFGLPARAQTTLGSITGT